MKIVTGERTRYARTCVLILAAGLAAAGQALAQQTQTTPKVELTTLPEVRTTVVVVGAPEPVKEEDSARSTATLDVQADKLTYSGAIDLLRDDPSVDIEERGGGGVQTDVTVRGGSFEQTLVLLNGLRINDAETSHFNLDLPVPVDALGSVNVLHGAGSTLYGSDAVSGVVDFTTAAPPPGPHLLLRAGAGSFGETEQAAMASWAGAKASEVLAGGREFSSGFIADRDYRSEEASSETRTHSVLGDTDVLLAGSDRAFGAAQFYGNFTSWERTKGWFASITQQFDQKTQAALGLRRHSDIFLLERDQPLGYKNQHVDTSWQAVVRRRDDLPLRDTGLFYGLEVNADQIESTNLGNHGRNRGAGYVNVEVLGKRLGTVAIGAREEVLSGGLSVFTPSGAASVRLPHAVKLRASVGRGFRVPTYTDLYYSDPSTRGNPNLKPESAWSFDGGADWYASANVSASLTIFQSAQTNAIDYVRPDSSVRWQAENLTGIHFTGIEAGFDWRPITGQQVRLALTSLSGARDALNGLQSKYVFNYPVQNASAEWIGRWKNGLLLRQRIRVVNRLQRDVYPVWDASAEYGSWRVKPYVRGTNLGNTAYQEIVGVPVPGRAFVAGIECALGKRD